jgi:hypothetical protein
MDCLIPHDVPALDDLGAREVPRAVARAVRARDVDVDATWQGDASIPVGGNCASDDGAASGANTVQRAHICHNSIVS